MHTVDPCSEHRLLLFVLGADVSLSPLISPRTSDEDPRVFVPTPDNFMATYAPKYWKDWEAVHHDSGPRVLSFDSIDGFIMEKLINDNGFQWLVQSYERALDAEQMLRDKAFQEFARKCSRLLLKYAVHFTAHPEDVPSIESGPKQMARWLCTSSDARRDGSNDSTRGRSPEQSSGPTPIPPPASRDYKACFCSSDAPSNSFLKAWSAQVSNDALPGIVKGIVFSLVQIAEEQTLASPDCVSTMSALARLLDCGSRFVEEFVLLPKFMPSWLHGTRFECESWFGAFFRFSAPQSEPSLVVTAFANAAHMSEQQIQLVVLNIRHKLEGCQEVLCWLLHRMLSVGLGRSGLLAWVAAVLLGNWERTRMRTQWRSASSNEFLLNLTSCILRIANHLLPPNSPHSADKIESDYFIGRRRLVLGDETRLQMSGTRIKEIIRSIPEPEHSADEQRMLRGSFSNVHSGIICDECRCRNMVGVRFKCMQCRDYDVCESCEQHLYEQALGLRRLPPSESHDHHVHRAVQFTCPFPDCDNTIPLSEVSFRSHVARFHASDSRMVVCPVCAANGVNVRHRRLHEHLHTDHTDTHDPVSHVMLRVERMVPSCYWKLFEPLPLIPLAGDDGSDPDAMAVETDMMEYGPDSERRIVAIRNRALSIQSRVVHTGVECHSCGQCPIVGLRFSCYNCDSVSLCARCFPSNTGERQHEASHLWLQIRRPLVIPSVVLIQHPPQQSESGPDENLSEVGVVSSSGARPILYPSCVVGSYGHDIATEWHFLTLHCLHLGLIQSCTRFTSIVQGIESERRLAQRKSLIRMRLAMSVQLLSPSLLSSVLAHYGLTARMMIRSVDPHLNGLPLLPVCPDNVAAMPEYLLEDMATFVIFLAQHSRQTFEAALPEPADMAIVRDYPMGVQARDRPSRSATVASQINNTLSSFHSRWIVHLFVYMLSSPAYTKNPYLRGKLVEALSAVAPFPTAHGPGCSRMKLLLRNDQFLAQHLLPSVVRLYISVEHTGSASQFYDKFNVRNVLSVLFNYLMTHREYRTSLSDLCEEGPEVMLQLVHCLISDAIYVLDEVLSKAESIAALLRQHRDAETLNALSATQRSELVRSLQQMKRNLRIVCTLSLEALRLLTTLASHPYSRAVLLRPEMVERIAHSINFYVVAVVDTEENTVNGQSELLSCGFDAVCFLRCFCNLYYRLSDSADFMKAVVRDGRCFQPAKFQKAVVLLQKIVSVYPDEVKTAADFFRQAEERFALEKTNMEELGHIPEDFLDPILHTLMEDPVVLPTSGVTVDRAVICRHLLSDSTDPFNRQYLTTEMLTPNVELKQRIDEFKSQQHD